jgi:hypothetical protein
MVFLESVIVSPPLLADGGKSRPVASTAGRGARIMARMAID